MKHLFVIATDPAPVQGYGQRPVALLACVSSRKEGVRHDDACELKAGDHPFITHDSFIDYRYTRVERAQDVEARVGDGTFIVKESCGADLLARIIRGAAVSRSINREFRQILAAVNARN